MAKKSLKKSKKANPKKLFLAVIAVALLGGLLVFVSNAGTTVTFTRYAKDMTGGHQNKLYNNGKSRSATSTILAPVTFKEAVASRVICVHYYVGTPSPANGLGFAVELDDDNDDTKNVEKLFSISGKAKGSDDYACLTLKQPGSYDPVTGQYSTEAEFRSAGNVKITMVGRGGILVDKVEGRK